MIDWRDPDGRPDRGDAASAARWIAAAIVVLAAHGGAAWLGLDTGRPAAPEGERPSPVMIELPPLAVGAEAPQTETSAPGGQAFPELGEAPDIPVPEIPPPESEQPERAEAEAPPEEFLPPPEPVPEIEIPPPPQTPVPREPAVSIPPRPEPEKRPPPKKPAERRKAVERREVPPPNRRRREEAAPTARTTRATRAGAPSTQAGASGGASPAAIASWRGTLNAHLARYKRVPAGTSGGVVVVAFTIDRSGRVISARLARSSGNPALDQEAASLPRRASPVPAPPAGVGGGTISLTIPIRYVR